MFVEGAEFMITEYLGEIVAKYVGKIALKYITKEGINYTKSNLELGKEIHKAYKVGLADNINTFKEYTGIKSIRPDFVDFNTKTIYEIKPNNPRSIQQGIRQLKKYKALFEKKYGGTWNIKLDTY